MLDINLGGVLNCTYAALPAMQAAKYGRIVSISSEAGRVGSKGSAVYSAAKAGIVGFTKAIAGERPRDTANAAPGPIENDQEFGEIGKHRDDERGQSRPPPPRWVASAAPRAPRRQR